MQTSEARNQWFVRPTTQRPAYWRVAVFLWGTTADIDSDGNSATPDDQGWTELTVALRPATDEDRVDVDPVLDEPLMLKVRSASSELGARAAFFIAFTTRGQVSTSPTGPFESPDSLRGLLGSIDVDAALHVALG